MTTPDIRNEAGHQGTGTPRMAQANPRTRKRTKMASATHITTMKTPASNLLFDAPVDCSTPGNPSNPPNDAPPSFKRQSNNEIRGRQRPQKNSTTCHSSFNSDSIRVLFAIRTGRAAARDELARLADQRSSDDLEYAYEEAMGAISDIDRSIMDLEPETLSELADQAAVVLDTDADFITADARLVLARVIAFAGMGGRA